MQRIVHTSLPEISITQRRRLWYQTKAVSYPDACILVATSIDIEKRSRRLASCCFRLWPPRPPDLAVFCAVCERPATQLHDSVSQDAWIGTQRPAHLLLYAGRCVEAHDEVVADVVTLLVFPDDSWEHVGSPVRDRADHPLLREDEGASGPSDPGGGVRQTSRGTDGAGYVLGLETYSLTSLSAPGRTCTMPVSACKRLIPLLTYNRYQLVQHGGSTNAAR